MSSPRWSSGSLLATLALGAALGFFGRQNIASTRLRAIQSQNVTLRRERIASARSPQKPPAEPSAAMPATKADRWTLLSGGPATPARDREMITAIDELAETNPSRAIEFACRETNQRLRAQLLDAALQGWGRIDARTAADWVLSQPADALDRDAGIASVLKSAIEDPLEAVSLTQSLNRQNPDHAREFGDALIYAFAQKGDFSSAADFATSGAGLLRTEWLAAAYGSWAAYQPQTAANSAAALNDPDARTDALNAVISGWGQIDPKGLADFAVSVLPEGGQRTHALSDALVFWAAQDPVAAANWIRNFGPAPDLDSGRAAVATQPDVMKQQPSVAINWAQSIIDLNLRSRTLVAVVETWWLSNRSGALNFLQTSGDLTPEDRTDLLSRLSY